MEFSPVSAAAFEIAQGLFATGQPMESEDGKAAAIRVGGMYQIKSDQAGVLIDQTNVLLYAMRYAVSFRSTQVGRHVSAKLAFLYAAGGMEDSKARSQAEDDAIGIINIMKGA